jgi:hypothetical protein
MPPELLSIGGPVLGGILGSIVGGNQYNQASQDLQQAYQNIEGLKAPTNSVNFQNYQNVGNFTPQQEQLFQQAPTQFSKINVNPAYMQSALAALQNMQNISNRGGFTAADQANLNNIVGQANDQAAGQRQALMQAQAQRGMGGSGFGLAQQLANQQNAANNANQLLTSVTGQAQLRALQAMQNQGTLGAQLNQQNFGQQAQAAQAQDLINQFNTGLQQNTGNQNTGLINNANQFNLQKNQGIANANTGLSNQQQTQNNDYRQQTYQDQLAQQQGAAGALNQQAQNSVANGNRLSGMIGGVGNAIGSYGTSSALNNSLDNLSNSISSSVPGNPALSQQVAGYNYATQPSSSTSSSDPYSTANLWGSSGGW